MLCFLLFCTNFYDKQNSIKKIYSNESTKNAFSFFQDRVNQHSDTSPQQFPIFQDDQSQKSKSNSDTNKNTKSAFSFFHDRVKQQLKSVSQPSQVIQKDQNQKSTIDTNKNTLNAFAFFQNKGIQQLESNPQQPKAIQTDQNQVMIPTKTQKVPLHSFKTKAFNDQIPIPSKFLQLKTTNFTIKG